MRKIDKVCPYCGWVLKLPYAISEREYYRLEYVFSDHLKDHQDEGEAPNKGRKN